MKRFFGVTGGRSVLCLALIFFSLSAGAGEWRPAGKITAIEVNRITFSSISAGMVISFDNEFNGGCTNGDRVAFWPNNVPNADNIYTEVLMAYLSGKPVSVWVENCDYFIQSPTAKAFRLSHE